MNRNYFVLFIMLGSAVTYAMEPNESTPKAQSSKSKKELLPKRQPQENSQALQLVPKDAMAVIHIKSLTNLISFNGEKKPLYQWLVKSEGHFGKTPIIIMDNKDKIKVQSVINANGLRNSAIYLNTLANNGGIYISNTHTRHAANKQSIQYGTLVISDAIAQSSSRKTIRTFANVVLTHAIYDTTTKARKKENQNKGKEPLVPLHSSKDPEAEKAS